MTRWIPAFLLVLGSPAYAQLQPLRLYNGIHRPAEVKVTTPQVTDLASIQLIEAGSQKVVEESQVQPGLVDLQTVFHSLWESTSSVRYAQLAINGHRFGPALVLDKMSNPDLSVLGKDGKTIKFVPDKSPTNSGLRIWIDQDVVLQTSVGNIRLHMRPDAAPNTVINFLDLVAGGFYRNIAWHRIVAKRKDGSPFVIQAGDPTGSGDGGPGYNIPLENSKLKHAFGVISMARSSDPNTNGSQFFICLSRKGTKHLDNRYSAFGEAVSGKDTILAIAAAPVGKEGRPLKAPTILNATTVDANPVGDEPRPLYLGSPG